MGIMDNLIKKEQNQEQSGGYQKQEKDKTLINTFFGLTKDNQDFNMTVKFLAYEDVFPEYEGILTRKIHYALFPKAFREEHDFDIKSLGVVADTRFHGFASYNPLEDLKWSLYNAFKATGEERFKKLSNKVQEGEESYIYIYVVDSSNADLVGKTFLYKIPVKIKNDYVKAQWTKFDKDVFSEDIYCRIDAEGFGMGTKWTFATDERKKFKDVPFETTLKKNGHTIEDVKEDMKRIDISRYDFKEDEELEKMEKIESELSENLASIWNIVTEYSKSKLKKKGDGVKSVNTSHVDDSNDSPKQFVVDEDEGDDDEIQIF